MSIGKCCHIHSSRTNKTAAQAEKAATIQDLTNHTPTAATKGVALYARARAVKRGCLTASINAANSLGSCPPFKTPSDLQTKAFLKAANDRTAIRTASTVAAVGLEREV